jgi:hypothetical protein
MALRCCQYVAQATPYRPNDASDAKTDYNDDVPPVDSMLKFGIAMMVKSASHQCLEGVTQAVAFG